jgi:glucarate dehydratase
VWIDEDILEGGKWGFQNGYMSIPEGPGLGITVDEDAVARMAEDYRKCGLTCRDDSGYMRRTYDPSWEVKRPRW